MTHGALGFHLAGENIDIVPTPALFKSLDEASGGLAALAERIEGGKLRHAELVDIVALLTQGCLHREEIENAIIADGAAFFIGLVARILAVYFSGMKNLEEILKPGEVEARS